MADTSRALRTTARRLTAERGLSGFTVDELCAAVGIARRTFFNYYAGKEHAVIGVPAHRDDSDLEELFLGSYSPHGPDTLVIDLAALVAGRLNRIDPQAEELRDARAAFEREPRLYQLFHEVMVADQQHDVELIERREGLPSGSMRAATAVRLIAPLLHAALDEFLADPDGASFLDRIERHLDEARQLLVAPASPRLPRKPR